MVLKKCDLYKEMFTTAIKTAFLLYNFHYDLFSKITENSVDFTCFNVPKKLIQAIWLKPSIYPIP